MTLRGVRLCQPGGSLITNLSKVECRGHVIGLRVARGERLEFPPRLHELEDGTNVLGGVVHQPTRRQGSDDDRRDARAGPPATDYPRPPIRPATPFPPPRHK